MILITVRHEESRAIVGIAGRLDQEHLAELREQCASAAHKAPGKLVFDLSDMRSAARAAIQWLGERSARGDEIQGASPYIKLLLERELQSSESLTTTGSRGASEEGE